MVNRLFDSLLVTNGLLGAILGQLVVLTMRIGK
jgi:hypothetical protein